MSKSEVVKSLFTGFLILCLVLVSTIISTFEMSGIYYTINWRVTLNFSIKKEMLTVFSMISCMVGGILTFGIVIILAKGNTIGESLVSALICMAGAFF